MENKDPDPHQCLIDSDKPLSLWFDEVVPSNIDLQNLQTNICAVMHPIIEAHTLISLPAEVTVKISSDSEIQELNKNFRDKDKPTNVLSFPSAPEDQMPNEPYYLGDIIISMDTLKQEAQNEHKRIEDHFTHLLIHGILHLLGYDHETHEEAEEMEGLEIKLLAQLNINNPYTPT